VTHECHNAGGRSVGVPPPGGFPADAAPYVPPADLRNGDVELGRPIPVPPERSLGGHPPRPSLLGGGDRDGGGREPNHAPLARARSRGRHTEDLADQERPGEATGITPPRGNSGIGPFRKCGM